MAIFWVGFEYDNGLLGAAILEAEGKISAAIRARDLGVAGEVLVVDIPEAMEDQFPIELRERLLSREEAEVFDCEEVGMN